MTLEELFATILELSPSDVTDELSPAALPTWDSLAQINIITGLEELFQVTLTTREMQAIRSVGDARRILAQKGVRP